MNIFFWGHSSFAAQELVKRFINNEKTIFFGRKNINFKNFTYFDLNNPNKTNFKKFKIKKIDYIFFFSSFVPLKEQKSKWSECKNTNIFGLIKLLKIIKIPIKKIIFVSSCSIYGDDKIKTYQEDSPAYPATHYALSKFAQEQIFRVYCYCNNIKFLCFRLGYVFGKNMNKERLVKKIILNFNKNKKIKLFNKSLNLNLIHTKDIDIIIFDTFKKLEGVFNMSYKYKITLGDFFNKVYFNRYIYKKDVNNFLNKKLLKLYPKFIKANPVKRIEEFIND